MVIELITREIVTDTSTLIITHQIYWIIEPISTYLSFSVFFSEKIRNVFISIESIRQKTNIR